MIFEPQMYGRKFWALSLAIGIAATAACSGSSNNSGFRGTEPNSRQFNVDQSLASVTFSKGLAVGNNVNLSLAVGSGAFRPLNASNNVFYTITDRGPTIPCADSSSVTGLANFCDGNAGSIFAVKDYAPQIIKWKLSGIGAGLKLEQTEVITLTDSSGSALNGLPNNLTGARIEKAYDNEGVELLPSAKGVDPEALVQLSNGSFWVAEENGPSLLLVSSTGEVLDRQVPAGMGNDFTNDPNGAADYPVSDSIIPAIFAKRKVDRGIEALAISPDNKYLYFFMQSALDNPEGAAADSRIVRVGKLELNSDGSANAMAGEFLYQLDSPSRFGIKSTGDGDLDGNGDFVAQSEVTINEAIALDEDYLVVVEQAKTVSKFYRLNLANATNILDGVWDSTTTSPSLEEQTAPANIKFITKQLGFDSLTMPLPAGIDPLAENIEGFALLDANFGVVLNDNNYGIGGVSSVAKVLPIGAFVVTATAPIEPYLDYAKSSSFTASGATYDMGAAKVVAADSTNKRLFVVNAQSDAVDILDITEPLSPVLASPASLDLAAAATAAGISLGEPKWVTVGGAYVAVALDNVNPQEKGIVAVYLLSDLSLVTTFEVGAAPKMAIFDLVLNRIVVANEGVPSDDYSVDPEGSVSIIDISSGVESGVVTDIGFSDFNIGGSRAGELPAAVRVRGPSASVAQDLEPEHIAVSLANTKLFVSLQENNAVAVINLADNTIDRIIALGRKDFGVIGNELDVKSDNAADIRTWPGVYGLYQPDGISTYRFGNKNYFVTANEGSPRTYSAYNEQVNANQIPVDNSNPSAADAADPSALGSLKVSSEDGDTDNDGDIDEITAFGARSFSIWNEQGQLMFDSGAELAQITNASLGAEFNDADTSSTSNGAGPKSIVLVSSLNRIYAFVSLQRAGGIAIYDITSPLGVQFVQYVNNRNFGAVTGDEGADGITTFFIDSKAYLGVANAKSGNVRILELNSGASTD
ncbi:choice-of-anchor I family protein [Zhongshania guokunii]|uniref:Choice-of-anchor I family protein n=1 Tax=Zhongshania guokunii TaxID=641783 RepID=A0ABV3U6X8_9GAMM